MSQQKAKGGFRMLAMTLVLSLGLIFHGSSYAGFFKNLGKVAFVAKAGQMAGRVWSIGRRLKDAQLPSVGKIRYVPPKGYNPKAVLPKGNQGFIDRFGNEWVKGPSRTKGEPFEWDVQLSSQGAQKIGHLSKDGKHVNVSMQGRVTH